MGDSHATDAPDRDRDHDHDRDGRPIQSAVAELTWFLALVTLWTVGLALLFLATAWPRWAFYAALLVGVLVFAALYPRNRPIRTGGDVARRRRE